MPTTALLLVLLTALLVVLGAALLLALVVALVLALGAAPRPAPSPPGPLQRVRTRLLLATAVGLAVLAAAAVLAAVLPGHLGRMLVAAPAVAATSALLVFGLTPWDPPPRDGARSAGLERRDPATTVPRVAAAVGALVVGALVAVVAACGAVADADQRSVTAVGRVWTFTLGPFPGWFYGVPLLAGVVGVVAGTLIALRRTALLPEVFEDRRADLRWRRQGMRAAIALAAATLLLDLAGVLKAVDDSAGSRTVADAASGMRTAPLLDLLTGAAVVWPLVVAAAVVALIAAVVEAAAIGRRWTVGPAVAA